MVDRSLVSIVDDDESVRESLPDLIREFGFSVRAFSSAEEFLASPSVDATSCLILDVQMPQMSGVELQSVLMAQGRCPPIVFMTAVPDEEMRDQALKAGAVCVLTKPFDVRTLGECIGKALKSRSDGNVG